MDPDVMFRSVIDLKEGDAYHGDFFQGGRWTFNDQNPQYTVIGEPIYSINKQLFPFDASNVVVVPVEYADGSRGSRLFNPGHQLPVRPRRT